MFFIIGILYFIRIHHHIKVSYMACHSNNNHTIPAITHTNKESFAWIVRISFEIETTVIHSEVLGIRFDEKYHD